MVIKQITMKTAMQELIEELEKRMKSYLSVDMALSASAIAITLMEAKKLLEKEKEHIIDAYCEGFKQGSEGNRIMSEEYYYDLYNQFIKKITITEFNQNI